MNTIFSDDEITVLKALYVLLGMPNDMRDPVLIGPEDEMPAELVATGLDEDQIRAICWNLDSAHATLSVFDPAFPAPVKVTAVAAIGRSAIEGL